MDMRVNIAGVEWKNPVTVASGTFGSGEEFSDFVDLNKLGAVTTKGVANVPWSGNPTPRVAEVYGGMMNAIGLQNPGIELFCERDIPFLKKYDTKIIVNVCGHAPEEYLAVVERLADEPIDMMEINILTGMKIDINRKTFTLANKTGGVSGPIVHPIAVRMVYQAAQAVKIPIIGMGGIQSAEDAIEFLLAGASAVSVGTANFYHPNITEEVVDGIRAYMEKNGFDKVSDMVGIVK